MTEQEALQVLENMPEQEFQQFFKSLPDRTQILIRGGMADWKSVLPAFYLLGKGQ